ncbi:hypothetical protein EVAR_10656_1 [Eumeta japonica]|uniref:Carboxylesterase type B domain-containing protein n=1 Tax=Eumeta variegata TaxID=151549 RepID=A0A4C1U7R6_EUMVA|nr:hypothetical protein EVAR_10656_1 [Eumeta japonica]
MNSANLHAENSARAVYFYEFSYVGQLSAQHNFVDQIRGASHRDQTSYIIDFYKWTGNYSDLDTRDRLTTMWTDFVKFEDPTAFESSLISLKWQKYSKGEKKYLSIDNDLKIKSDPLPNGFEFWKKIYEKNYWHPTPLTPENINKINKNKKK